MTHRNDNIGSTTRGQHVESLVTYGIADKTAYISETTKLCLTFLPLLLVSSMQSIPHEYIKPALFHVMMQSPSNQFQITYGSGLTESTLKANCGNVHLL